MTQNAGRSRSMAIILGLTLISYWPAVAMGEPPLIDPELRSRALLAMDRGARFLVSSQQPDGGWEIQGQSNVGISAMVVKALAQAPGAGPRHESVQRGLAFVRKFVHEDGGIYNQPEGHLNYHTSVALMAIVAVNDPADAKLIADAQKFLTKLQWDEGEGYEKSSTWYGGAGYGNGKRPDLSNTQMMIEALKESGLPPNDPAYQKALVFISRCQMDHKINDQEFAVGAVGGDDDDGGFIYSPVNGGESKAGTKVINGREQPRSYGSMTYAAFKSMLYAQLDRTDPRVERARQWIGRHYTLEENPNMPGKSSKEGLFYFYHVFAKALSAWGEEEILDGRGVRHRWRDDLIRKLLELQRSDGSWVNEADRWYEGNPYLVTAYSMLALEEALAQHESVPSKP